MVRGRTERWREREGGGGETSTETERGGGGEGEKGHTQRWGRGRDDGVMAGRMLGKRRTRRGVGGGGGGGGGHLSRKARGMEEKGEADDGGAAKRLDGVKQSLAAQ